MARVVLAMSGGVDSSVAAWLLRQEGHAVIGVFMRHGEESVAACAREGECPPLPLLLEQRADHKQGCCGAEDARDARRVADRLDIPFYSLNFQADFRHIIDYFVDEYLAARTPNPCVICNQRLKFGKLFEYARSVEADYVATGHHARLVPGPDGEPPSLCRGVDPGKDQSYALFGIDRKNLRRMLLPVGHFEKSEIRRLAAELRLPIAEKRDSQEICFVTSGKHDEFVRTRRGNLDTSGLVVTVTGQVVGNHSGIERFTVGQRRGLGIALGEPYFVVRIEADTKRVVLGRKDDLARTELTANGCNWLVPPQSTRFRCQAKIRYNSVPAAATAECLPDNRLRVVFDERRFGVAPGQAVVCYDNERVLGGGWIE